MKKIAFTSMALVLLNGCVVTETRELEEKAVSQSAQQLSANERKKAKEDDRGHRARPMTEQRLDWLLAEYNANDDEQLTWAEYNNWRQSRFNKTDSNDNGTVDAEEYVYEFENRLDERYEEGRKAHVKQTKRRFTSLDKDESNAIEWNEYEASGDRIFARWDTNSDGNVNELDPKKESKYSKNKSNSSWNSNNPINYIRMPSTHSLKGLKSIYDANEDDAVSTEEFVSARRSVFYVTDTNKDGVLSLEEYLAEFEERIDQTVDKNRRSAIKQTYVRFNALDDNKDKAMTFEEFQISGKRIFTRWDKNDDGVISNKDITANVAK